QRSLSRRPQFQPTNHNVTSPNAPITRFTALVDETKGLGNEAIYQSPFSASPRWSHHVLELGTRSFGVYCLSSLAGQWRLFSRASTSSWPRLQAAFRPLSKDSIFCSNWSNYP
uniref:Nucleoporin_N domain-containing protein n=1 Tax=Mesocestoides corti TaxID=53468 RepID=A0A5K3FWQ5_MESCO